MQRDIGNEVIVAIVVVSVLAFALTFGIILSLSNSNAGAVTQSNVATDGPTDSVESSATTPSSTATDTPPDDPTVVDEPTSTDRPTDQPTTAATATLAPSATREPSATDAATATLTQTPAPSRTPLPAATSTPTATASPTPTTTMTLTRTPTITRTRTITLTPSPSPTIGSPTPLLGGGICIAPFGWVVYEVQPGDTLLSIAQKTGSTIDALRVANCLESINQFQVGDRLSVPGVAAVEPPVPGLEVQGCTAASAQITNPRPGARVRGSFILVGTATLDNFSYFQIEIRPDDSTTFNFYARSTNPVVDGVLGTVELRGYDTGLHWVRLSIVDDSGMVNTRPCAIPLFFE